MCLLTKINVFVPILETIRIDGKEAYKVIMPSGLKTVVWAADCLVI